MNQTKRLARAKLKAKRNRAVRAGRAYPETTDFKVMRLSAGIMRRELRWMRHLTRKSQAAGVSNA